MAHRAFTTVAYVSVALLVATLVLTVGGIWLNPSDHHLSLGERFHIGVGGHGWDRRLVLFSDGEGGPYAGSVVSLLGADGDVRPALDHLTGFGDTAGIYYRYIRSPDATVWTLTLSLWYPIVLFAILPAIWWTRKERRRERGQA